MYFFIESFPLNRCNTTFISHNMFHFIKSSSYCAFTCVYQIFKLSNTNHSFDNLHLYSKRHFSRSLLIFSKILPNQMNVIRKIINKQFNYECNFLFAFLACFRASSKWYMACMCTLGRGRWWHLNIRLFVLWIFLNSILCRKVNWICSVLRRNCLLHGVTGRHITEVKGQGRGRIQLLDDFRNRRRY